MKKMKFEVKKFDAGGRLGIINHNNKKLTTPTILPVVSPFENVISPKILYEEFKVDGIFTNAYILYNNKEKASLAESKGIHSYLNYDGLIATDSGAFQHYMYGNEGDITADEIELFQERIKSDFPVILDVPVQLDDSRDIARSKIRQTIERAQQNVKRRTSSHGAWYGPIHGTLYPDIIKESCEGMSLLDFGVYAVGGIVKAMNDYAFDICVEAFLTVKKYLRKDRPVHMFGLGLPQFFSLAVATGADLMDSAAYILFAKEGRYFTMEGTRHIMDLNELPCYCPVCASYNANEISTFFKLNKKKKNGQNKGIELLARHNLHVSLGELRTIRESIRSGNLWDLVEQRIQAHPKLIKAYKKIPNYWGVIEEQIPLEKKKGQLYKGNISFIRPIFDRMTSKVQKNYILTKNSILLFIPELEETLFNSQDGREWINTIEHCVKMSDINLEPFVISPVFGIIPLDLYGIYPFSQRDWVEPSEIVINSLVLNVISIYINNNIKHIERILIFDPTSKSQEPSEYRYFTRLVHKIKNTIKTNKKIDLISSFVDLEEKIS